MPRRSRSPLVSGVLFAVLFLGGLAGGYVYRHEPAPDTVEVQIATDSSSAMRTVTGTVTSVEGGRLTISTAGGPVSVALPASAPVDELVRAADGLPDGTRVNVGVQSTQYGLALTGLVAVEGAP